MSENKVTRNGNKVIKEFASHFNYIAEDKAYTLLKGKKMTPMLFYSGQDIIEHEYIEGPNMLDVIKSNLNEPPEIKKVFEDFYSYYKAFYELTGMNLVTIDFSKFIYGPESLVYVDFEHTKIGGSCNDIAKLIVFIYFNLERNPDKALYLCRLFLETGMHYLTFTPGLLPLRVRRECEEIVNADIFVLRKGKSIGELCSMVEEVLNQWLI